MKTELENNKITTGFTTPTSYFDTFSDRLLEKMNGEVTSSVIPKSSGFVVPSSYFESNQEKILVTVKQKQQPKVIHLKTMLYKVGSIAAILILTVVSPILYNSIEVQKNEVAEMNYLELHSDDLDIYEVGSLLDNTDLSELENELIYNDLNTIN